MTIISVHFGVNHLSMKLHVPPRESPMSTNYHTMPLTNLVTTNSNIQDRQAYNHQEFSFSQIWIPMSISSIEKSPTPEKWTIALENKINTLISRNFFDIPEVDPSTIDKKFIIIANTG